MGLCKVTSECEKNVSLIDLGLGLIRPVLGVELLDCHSHGPFGNFIGIFLVLKSRNFYAVFRLTV